MFAVCLSREEGLFPCALRASMGLTMMNKILCTLFNAYCNQKCLKFNAESILILLLNFAK